MKVFIEGLYSACFFFIVIYTVFCLSTIPIWTVGYKITHLIYKPINIDQGIYNCRFYLT